MYEGTGTYLPYIWFYNQLKRYPNMAKPISETPVLRGENAKRFLESMIKPRNQDEVKKERERVLRNYNAIKNSSPVGSSTATK